MVCWTCSANLSIYILVKDGGTKEAANDGKEF